jgi:hypothetical protein
VCYPEDCSIACSPAVLMRLSNSMPSQPLACLLLCCCSRTLVEKPPSASATKSFTPARLNPLTSGACEERKGYFGIYTIDCHCPRAVCEHLCIHALCYSRLRLPQPQLRASRCHFWTTPHNEIRRMRRLMSASSAHEHRRPGLGSKSVNHVHTVVEVLQ